MLHQTAGYHASSKVHPLPKGDVLPIECEFDHLLEVALVSSLGSTLRLVTLTQHILLAMFLLALIQAVSQGQLWQHTRSLSM
jgi:hypothetical protein